MNAVHEQIREALTNLGVEWEGDDNTFAAGCTVMEAPDVEGVIVGVPCDTVDEALFTMRVGGPVDKLDMSGRAKLFLKRAGIRSVAELVRCSRKQLLTLKGISDTSADEIERALQDIGLSLAQ